MRALPFTSDTGRHTTMPTAKGLLHEGSPDWHNQNSAEFFAWSECTVGHVPMEPIGLLVVT